MLQGVLGCSSRRADARNEGVEPLEATQAVVVAIAADDLARTFGPFRTAVGPVQPGLRIEGEPPQRLVSSDSQQLLGFELPAREVAGGLAAHARPGPGS